MDHTVAVRTDGTLWAWGGNNYGQLGDGTTTNRTRPEQSAPRRNWASVAAGGSHTVAIRTDGTLWAWGWNAYGQLGDGATTNRANPVSVGTATTWASVAAGEVHTVAVRTNGMLWAWGANGSGQLGDGTTTDQHRPERIDGHELDPAGPDRTIVGRRRRARRLLGDQSGRSCGQTGVGSSDPSHGSSSEVVPRLARNLRSVVRVPPWARS